MNLGAPVFLREILAQSRRKRTYVLQTIFLAVLVLLLIPFWPEVGGGRGAEEISSTGASIFEWGGYIQLILLTLLAPASTANAITLEKDKKTLDLLLLTDAGPHAIVWGKFFSRLFGLVFILFLTLPLLFALLTLGGVSAGAILTEFVILVAYAALGAGLGIFLSTILPKVTGVLITGYALLAALLALPLMLRAAGTFESAPGTYDARAAYISPLYDLVYLFDPSAFVSTQSVPEQWWICPLWCASAGVGLVFLSALLLPYAQSFERALSARWLLDGFDRGVSRALTLHPVRAALTKPSKVELTLGKQNPIYWKETSVNTIGRFKYWWRINLVLLLVMGAAIYGFWDYRGDVRVHKGAVSVLAGLVVLLTTVIAATTVSREREDGSLQLMACSPVTCATYVKGKVRGIARNISFLVVLPLLYVALFTAAGVIHPLSPVLVLVAIPAAVVASIMQGIWLSLLFPTTLRAILGALVLVILEGTLPAVCCLPTFNLPVACFYIVEPIDGVGSSFQTTNQASYLGALTMAVVFSAGAQLGYTVVVYSLVRSGFDRYVGRA